MPPDYPFLWRLLVKIIYDVSRHNKRNFRLDAISSLNQLFHPCNVRGLENIPSQGGYLITVNHYARPGFSAWWLAFSVSAYVPHDIRWVMTEAWRYDIFLLSWLFTPVTKWAFSKVADIYGFFLMPPMPPKAEDLRNRSLSIRRVLKFIRENQQSVIGLAPEGRDFDDGCLHMPPPGLGKFVLKIATSGFKILPAGVFERDGSLCLRFGEMYTIEEKDMGPSSFVDQMIARKVMEQIAACLPVSMRGEFN